VAFLLIPGTNLKGISDLNELAAVDVDYNVLYDATKRVKVT
jgi:hypothetical protein